MTYQLKYPKNWKYYLEVCKKLGYQNAMSPKQFDHCVENGNAYHTKAFDDYGYNYKQTNNEISKDSK